MQIQIGGQNWYKMYGRVERVSEKNDIFDKDNIETSLKWTKIARNGIWSLPVLWVSVYAVKLSTDKNFNTFSRTSFVIVVYMVAVGTPLSLINEK